ELLLCNRVFPLPHGSRPFSLYYFLPSVLLRYSSLSVSFRSLRFIPCLQYSSPFWVHSHHTMNRGPRPPGLPRLHKNKIRLCARLSSHDLRPGCLSYCTTTNQILLPHTTKSHSRHAFDTVFTPECAQSEISSSLLPDLLHGLLSGIDGCLISFGGSSATKNASLYSSIHDQQGISQSTISYLFPILEKSVEAIRSGYMVKLSAIHYSQRTDAITDLLSQFNTDPRRFPVRIVEDAVEGARIENVSEIRVDSIDQAMFYLNTVIDFRLIEEEETQRLSHLFITLSLYRSERKSSFHLVDLGMGERNSQRGSLSMPSIGNILISLSQGQKNLPNRDSTLGQLLRCEVGRCRLTTILCSFAHRRDENENILQLASKLSKARRVGRRVRGIESSSVSSTERKKRSDLESSSEQSTAETVIYLGRRSSGKDKVMRESRIPTLEVPLKPLEFQLSPIHCSSSPSHCSLPSPSREGLPGSSVAPLLKGYTPFFSPYSRVYEEMISPPGTSKGIIDDEEEDEIPRVIFGGASKSGRREGNETDKRRHREAEEEEKRQAILLWMEESMGSEKGKNDGEDEDDDYEENDCLDEKEGEIRLPRPLEDILEMDEDSLRESIRSGQSAILTNGKHPLSILSREAIDGSEVHEGESLEGQDGDLERAMGASISSVLSHDMLTRVRGELLKETSRTSSLLSMEEEPSEMDVYRRASHLEEYGNERLKELNENERQRQKKRMGLNCCQTSSSSSNDAMKKEEEERKEELRRRRDELKEEEEELRRRREEIKRQLEPPLLKQFTTHLSNFTLKAAGLKRVDHSSDSLPSTPIISSRKVVFPSRTPSLSNSSSPIHRSKSSSLPVRKERRSGRSREKEESGKKREEVTPSHSNLSLRSPYSKVTPARVHSGAESSGRGSDDNGSSLVSGKKNKRESYSASSGYESATGDYRYYSRNEKNDRFRVIEKRCGMAARESDKLREKQRKLQMDLREAKERIGERVEEWGELEGKSALSHTTLLDTLMQVDHGYGRRKDKGTVEERRTLEGGIRHLQE
ncbi:hypothetical protein PMAYCL1PPCAC_29558, partial [Pristionchus mayeri]